MTAFKLTSAPAAEPVSLSEAKSQARVDTSSDDTLITNLIIGARQWVEKYTGRALITQTWQLWLDDATDIEANYIVLPRAPLQSVSSVMVYDDSDNGTAWSSSNYFVDTVREPGRLALRTSASWPTPTRCTNGIKIEYIVGYSADGSYVPEIIKTAIRQLVAHWYEHRGEAPIDSDIRSSRVSVHVPLVIQALLDPYRVRSSGI